MSGPSHNLSTHRRTASASSSSELEDPARRSCARFSTILHLDHEVIGFLDDDPGKKGRSIHGVPVFGAVDLLPEVLRKHEVDQVFISTPSASGSEMRRIIAICEGCRAAFKTLPAIGQILDGQVSIKALRDVNYEDLLRRAPVHLDTAGMQDYLSGRSIMVTGAGGSIGSELCRQLDSLRSRAADSCRRCRGESLRHPDGAPP